MARNCAIFNGDAHILVSYANHIVSLAESLVEKQRDRITDLEREIESQQVLFFCFIYRKRT